MLDSVSQTSLAAAPENEAARKATHDEKKGTLASAVAAKDKLIASAASGAVVKPDDVLKAEGAVRQAEIEAQIAGQVHAGARTLRHLAEIEKWHAEAGTLSDTAESALVERVAAARVVDEARAVLESAIVKFHDAGTVFENARRAAALFNADAPARLAVNPVLAAAPQGTGPHTKLPHNTKVRRLLLIVAEQSGWLDAPKSLQNIAAGEALLAGRRDLLPTA